jgi:putative DNA methylase
MRQSLKGAYPELFRTILAPKADELVANPFKFEGSGEKARQFFEDGMLEAFKRIHGYAADSVPVTVYYAFKQNDEDEFSNSASTGWETMLSAIVQAGFAITGTWPLRTERAARKRGVDSNALASSIVLVCRKRPKDAPICTRRDFINALRRELKPALRKLQASNIAPVDLAQSAIGPGMSVYTSFSEVLEADGSPMGVRGALQQINQELDRHLSALDDD